MPGSKRSFKYNGCLAWGGSVVSAVIISILLGVAVIGGLVEFASLRILRNEENIRGEFRRSIESITPPSNSTLVSSEIGMAKDKICLFSGPFVSIDDYYSADISPMAVYQYYDQKLKEQGWNFMYTNTDWNNGFQEPCMNLEASYSKTGNYHAMLEYANRDIPAPWTYHIQMEWQGSNYPCN